MSPEFSRIILNEERPTETLPYRKVVSVYIDGRDTLATDYFIEQIRAAKDVGYESFQIIALWPADVEQMKNIGKRLVDEGGFYIADEIPSLISKEMQKELMLQGKAPHAGFLWLATQPLSRDDLVWKSPWAQNMEKLQYPRWFGRATLDGKPTPWKKNLLGRKKYDGDWAERTNYYKVPVDKAGSDK